MLNVLKAKLKSMFVGYTAAQWEELFWALLVPELKISFMFHVHTVSDSV